MRYVTSVERLAQQEGIEQGIEQGEIGKAREDILEILSIRFEVLPESLVAQINQFTNTVWLKQLLRQAVVARSLAEFEDFLALQRQPGAQSDNGTNGAGLTAHPDEDA